MRKTDTIKFGENGASSRTIYVLESSFAHLSLMCLFACRTNKHVLTNRLRTNPRRESARVFTQRIYVKTSNKCFTTTVAKKNHIFTMKYIARIESSVAENNTFVIRFVYDR